MGGVRAEAGAVRHRGWALMATSDRGEQSVAQLVLTGIRGVTWWIRSVMGDNAYARYVQHLALHHPGETPPTEREYWRERYAEMDAKPGARCC